jgi:YD repeat-containing protein
MPKTTYYWDELSDNVAAEYEDGILSASYTHEPGLYGNLLSQNRNGVTSYYHYDGRGDTVALTDDSGNITDTKEYDAWGNVIASTGGTVTPYLFRARLGCRNENILHQIAAHNRFYQPKTGTLTSVGWLTIGKNTSYSPVAILEYAGVPTRVEASFLMLIQPLRVRRSNQDIRDICQRNLDRERSDTQDHSAMVPCVCDDFGRIYSYRKEQCESAMGRLMAADQRITKMKQQMANKGCPHVPVICDCCREQRGHPNWIDNSELEKYPTSRQANSIELGKKSWHESIGVRFCRLVRFRLCIASIGA